MTLFTCSGNGKKPEGKRGFLPAVEAKGKKKKGGRRGFRDKGGRRGLNSSWRERKKRSPQFAEIPLLGKRGGLQRRHGNFQRSRASKVNAFLKKEGGKGKSFRAIMRERGQVSN